MKHTLFYLLLGLTPLLVLTGWSVYDMCMVTSSGLPDDTDVLTRAMGMNADVTGRIMVVRDSLDALAFSEILLASHISALSTLEYPDPDFLTLKEDWRRWVNFSSAMHEYVKTLKKTQTYDVDNLIRAVNHIKVQVRQIKENVPLAPLPPEEADAEEDKPVERVISPESKKFITVLDKQLEELDNQIILAKERKEATKLLTEARSYYDQKHYAEARDSCNTLLTDYDHVLAESVRAQVKLLKARSEVKTSPDVLSDIKLENLEPHARLKKLNAFFKTLGNTDASTLSETERNQITEAQRALEKTQYEVKQIKQEDRIRSMIGKIKNASTPKMETLLKAAARVADEIETLNNLFGKTLKADSSQMHVKMAMTRKLSENLHVAVVNHLKNILPEKRSGLSPLMKEATMKDGSLMNGFFKEVKDQGVLIGFKCYPTVAEFNKPTAAVGTHLLSEFQSLPSVPLPEKTVRAYMLSRKKLLEAPEKRVSWVNFSAACTEAEKHLAAYATTQGAMKNTLNFNNEKQNAETVLMDSNWALMSSIYP